MTLRRRPCLLLPLCALAPFPPLARSAAAPDSAPRITRAGGGGAIEPFHPPTPGKEAPDFSLLDEAGNRVASEMLKGTPFLLAFYPKDFTGG